MKNLHALIKNNFYIFKNVWNYYSNWLFEKKNKYFVIWIFGVILYLIKSDVS